MKPRPTELLAQCLSHMPYFSLHESPPPHHSHLPSSSSAWNSSWHMVAPHQKFIEWKNQHLPLIECYLHCSVFPAVSFVLCSSKWTFHCNIPLSIRKTSLLTSHDWADCASTHSWPSLPLSQVNGSPWKTIDDFCHLRNIIHDKILEEEEKSPLAP